MRIRRLVLALLSLASLFALSACGLIDGDAAPDYRYRLTVEVETPEGMRSGSSVIEVRQAMGRTAMSGGGKRISRKVKGEAVAIDMPDGKVLFALLRSDEMVDWSANIMQWMAPKIQNEPWEERFDNMLLIEGELEIPRRFATHPLSERTSYPMLVTFEDLADPTSVMRVDPDDLATSFGEGVSLKRITVQVTDDPVTTGIEERLRWLDSYRQKKLDGRPSRYTDLTTNELSARFSAGSFSTEFAK